MPGQGTQSQKRLVEEVFLSILNDEVASTGKKKKAKQGEKK